MPDIKELLKVAESKQKKQFSRGNRPDTLVNNNPLENNIISKIHTQLNTSESSVLSDLAAPTHDMHKSEIDGSKASQQQDTNGTQTQHKRDTDEHSQSTQTGHNWDTNGTQLLTSSVNNNQKDKQQDTNGTQTQHKRDTKSDTKSDTNYEDLQSKETAIKALKGSPAKLFVYVCESLISSGLTELVCSYEQLAFEAEINRGSVETTLKRLSNEKNLIIKKTDKGGVGARIYLSVGHDVFLLYSKYQMFIKRTFQTGHKRDTESDTNRDTNPSSKLVSYINTNYLSEGNQNSSVTSSEVDTKSAQNSGWFKNLDFSSLPGIKPLMVNSAIRDLVQSRLDPDDVQMFINKFKNWLSMQVKIKNPLAIFCDKLKEFANEGDSPILEVMSDDEIQIELKMAQEIEKKRAEMELINKARSFKLEQENEARFEEWLLAASDEDKKALQPESSIAPFGSKIYLITLKEAFLNQVNQNRGVEL